MTATLDDPSAPEFRLGFIVHFDGREPVRRLYREHIELFVAAEEMGFDTGWVAVRHFNLADGGLPSAPPFLAAAAERTTSIRLGTAVVALPFENATRLAHDAAFVDELSGGRLELGVGSGPFPPVFSAFGIDADDRRGIYRRRLDELKEALAALAPSLLDRLWQATSDNETAAVTAREGDGLMLQRFDPRSAEPIDRGQLETARIYEGSWNKVTAAPRIATSRSIFPSLDRDGGRSKVIDGLDRWIAPLVKAKLYPPGLSVAEYLDRENLRLGSPEAVAIGLRSDLVLPHTTELILGFQPALLTLEENLAQLQLTSQVARLLGWQPRHALMPSS